MEIGGHIFAHCGGKWKKKSLQRADKIGALKSWESRNGHSMTMTKQKSLRNPPWNHCSSPISWDWVALVRKRATKAVKMRCCRIFVPLELSEKRKVWQIALLSIEQIVRAVWHASIFLTKDTRRSPKRLDNFRTEILIQSSKCQAMTKWWDIVKNNAL